MFEKGDPSRRRLDAPTRTRKHWNTKIRLQLRDSFADGGRLNVRLFRSSRDIPLIANGHEEPQRLYIDLSHRGRLPFRNRASATGTLERF